MRKKTTVLLALDSYNVRFLKSFSSSNKMRMGPIIDFLLNNFREDIVLRRKIVSKSKQTKLLKKKLKKINQKEEVKT